MYPQVLARPAGRIIAAAFGLLVVAFTGPAWPQSADPAPLVRAGHLAITGAWARATPPAARTGAVYLTVSNDGANADRLVAATSPAAAAAELHSHTMEGGVARMRAVEAVEISPGEPAVFQPGGLHLMLVDLRAPLRDGQSLSLTLTFARAGPVTLEVPVRRAPPTAAGPTGHPHQH